MKLHGQHPPTKPNWVPVRDRTRDAFGKELAKPRPAQRTTGHKQIAKDGIIPPLGVSWAGRRGERRGWQGGNAFAGGMLASSCWQSGESARFPMMVVQPPDSERDRIG